MKKFLSMLLALTLILSMGTMAFAEAEPETVEPQVTEGTKFKKTYATTSNEDVFPSEILSFDITAADDNPDGEMITIAPHTVESKSDDIAVSLPTYTKVGKWNYTIREIEGNTQGVTYAETTIGVQVLVTYGENDELTVQTVFTTPDDNGNKVDEIINTYDLGSLKIAKEVAGNLASTTQKFDIDVTLTTTDNKVVCSNIIYNGNEIIEPEDWENGSVTVTIQAADGDEITFENIPAGVSYKVEEQAKHLDEDSNGSDPSKGYEVTYDNQEGEISAGVESAATVTNTKGAEVETGINMDSLPYILLLAVAIVGLFAFLGKKRFAHEN